MEAGRGSRSFPRIKGARIFAWVLEFHNHSTMGPSLLSEAGTYAGQMWAAAVELPWPGPWQETVLKDTAPL